jgi:hypothetical protein
MNNVTELYLIYATKGKNNDKDKSHCSAPMQTGAVQINGLSKSRQIGNLCNVLCIFFASLGTMAFSSRYS